MLESRFELLEPNATHRCNDCGALLEPGEPRYGQRLAVVHDDVTGKIVARDEHELTRRDDVLCCACFNDNWKNERAALIYWPNANFGHVSYDLLSAYISAGVVSVDDRF